jgi:hypothetical protein
LGEKIKQAPAGICIEMAKPTNRLSQPESGDFDLEAMQLTTAKLEHGFSLRRNPWSVSFIENKIKNGMAPRLSTMP